MEESKEVTPEQRKELEKVLSTARKSLFWLVVKFSLGLFFSNLLAAVIGLIFLSSVDPDKQMGFLDVCFVINFIFIVRYSYGQFEVISDTVANRVKEILKK